jgi:chemotaxis protein MotB
MATYADMVTLLMTFFVLMFAISNVDSQKASLLFAALSRDGLNAEAWAEIMYQSDVTPADDWYADRFPLPGIPDPDPDAGNPELDDLFMRISMFIHSSGLGDDIALEYDGDLLLMTVANDILFTPGSAVLLEPMRESGAFLARILAETQNDENPFEIIVTGHTDNVPIATLRYPSNWYLSMDRATNFLSLLLRESGLDAGYFSVRGFGEERPVGDNDTPEGRQANRRVEVQVTMLREAEHRQEQRMALARDR